MGEDRVEAKKSPEGRKKSVDRLDTVLNVNEEIALRKWKGKGTNETNICCILRTWIIFETKQTMLVCVYAELKYNSLMVDDLVELF